MDTTAWNFIFYNTKKCPSINPSKGGLMFLSTQIAHQETQKKRTEVFVGVIP